MSIKNKIPLLIIVGPTGIGKSSLAQKLAIHLKTSIVHADSRQIYKEMDIGTAKPTPAMRQEVPHYMLDVVSPEETFNAGRYSELASAVIKQIWFEEKKIPVIEGGTGLYIRALVDGLFEGPPANPQIRERLKVLAEEKGAGYLHQEVAKVDSVSAERLHPNDISRLIRALEVFELTGKPLSSLQQNMPTSPYQPMFFGLDAERAKLYQWIEERTDIMMAEGFLEEVKHLVQKGYSDALNSMQSLGYQEMAAHLRGEYSLEEAINLLKRDTRRYAKRQLTWFRQDKRIQWLHVEHPSKTKDFAPQIINNNLTD